MTKYIYHDKHIRCRLKLTGYGNQIELQIQRRRFVLWFNVGEWMHIDEGFWGECRDKNHPLYKNALIMDYQYGNISETYVTGTLNVKERVQKFFQDYFYSIREINKTIKNFNNI